MTTATRRAALTLAAAAALVRPAFAQPAPTIKVGSTPTGTPFTFLDTATNTITGFMVDLVTAVGRSENFAVDVQATPFAALIPSLTTSRIDLISAAMLATPARREQVDFSDPIYGYGEGLAVKDGDTAAYKTIADLKGVAVGAQIGTLYIEPLRAAGADVRTYESGADIIRDLTLGRIKAGVFDGPIMAYNIGQGTFRGVRMVADYTPAVVGHIAMATRRNDPLMARVNAGIAKVKAGPDFAALIAKWKLPASV